MEWFLEGFGSDDELACRLPLPGTTTEDIRSITGQPPEDPMYDAFSLPDAHLRWAERAAAVALDPSRLEYFLVAELDDEWGPSGMPAGIPSDARPVKPKTPVDAARSR